MSTPVSYATCKQYPVNAMPTNVVNKNMLAFNPISGGRVDIKKPSLLINENRNTIGLMKLKYLAKQIRKPKLDSSIINDTSYCDDRNIAEILSDRQMSKLLSKPTGSEADKVDNSPCDCLDKACPGCFYACEKCQSTKCGVHCRVGRCWSYQKVYEDNDEF